MLELDRAYAAGTDAFLRKIREMMTERVVIVHDAGIPVSICDLDYEFMSINEATLRWLCSDFAPISGPYTVFGAAEEWKEASNRPTRQVVFLIAGTGDVVGYERGVLFYVAPGLREFWTASVIFEHDNSFYPKAIRRRVRQASDDLAGYVRWYNRLRLQKVLLETRESRNRFSRLVGTVSRKSRNRLRCLLTMAAEAIASGSLPEHFSDSSALYENIRFALSKDAGDQDLRGGRVIVSRERRAPRWRFSDLFACDIVDLARRAWV